MGCLIRFALILGFFTVESLQGPVLISKLPQKERDRYEKILQEAVYSYRGFLFHTMFEHRNVDQTTFEEDDKGHLTMNFFTKLHWCSVGMTLLNEVDGKETVVVDNSNILYPRHCRLKILVPILGGYEEVDEPGEKHKNVKLDEQDKKENPKREEEENSKGEHGKKDSKAKHEEEGSKMKHHKEDSKVKPEEEVNNDKPEKEGGEGEPENEDKVKDGKDDNSLKFPGEPEGEDGKDKPEIELQSET